MILILYMCANVLDLLFVALTIQVPLLDKVFVGKLTTQQGTTIIIMIIELLESFSAANYRL